MPANLLSARMSRLPQVIGKCASDVPGIAAYVNEATQRLIYASGETGWWGGWKRVLFPVVSTANPYITLPRQFARAINLDVCTMPVRIHNEFWEFLPGGVGLRDPTNQPDWCGNLAGYERGTVPTMVDLTTTNQLLRVYFTDSRDAGARILVSGLDQNSLPIYSQDGLVSVNGFYITLAAPFATSTFIVTSITSIQKDATFGDVILKQVDATTGVEVTLSRYGPDEMLPAYRRYYLTNLPSNCCTAAGATVSVYVTALCKLEFIPVTRDTDMLILGNIPALISECQAIRYSEMDVTNAAQLEVKCHRQAIRFLQNEQRHMEGEQEPAVSVDTFQGAPLSRQSIGILI